MNSFTRPSHFVALLIKMLKIFNLSDDFKIVIGNGKATKPYSCIKKIIYFNHFFSLQTIFMFFVWTPKYIGHSQSRLEGIGEYIFDSSGGKVTQILIFGYYLKPPEK